MRIAYLTETFPPEVNGVSLTVARAVQHLRERGHQVFLVRPRQAGEAPRDDADEWLTAGSPIPMYPDLRFGLAGPVALRQRLAARQVQVLHIATPGPLAWAGLRAARTLGLPTSSDFRTNFHQYSRYYGLGLFAPLVFGALRRFHNLTDCTFVPTLQAYRELGRQGFSRLVVVGRGVDTARFHPSRRSEALRDSWGAAPGDTVLLYVGRLAAEKNVPLALAAFERLRRERGDVHLVLVGDGPARRALQAAHPQARFVGMLRGEALAACYASADLFAFPSLSETFGNVVLEAMASGLPPVAFRAAAAAEHVEHQASGLLVPPGDSAGFVDAVLALAGDAMARRAMGIEAAQAASRARWDQVLARFEHRLKVIADAPRAQATAAAARA